PDHERVIAYQALKTKNYTRALTAWNSIPLKQMTPDDILSAAITAQTAGDARELRKWISISMSKEMARKMTIIGGL
ncbi:MAG TPA: hypothetical protein DCW35_05020, partial [Polynucleobacter sp.]|nr:hypothetical protein [Polynucleobacter sp.]